MKNEIKRQVRRQKRNCRKCNQKHKAEKHFYPLSSKRIKNCYSAIGLINNVLKKKQLEFNHKQNEEEGTTF